MATGELVRDDVESSSSGEESSSYSSSEDGEGEGEAGEDVGLQHVSIFVPAEMDLCVWQRNENVRKLNMNESAPELCRRIWKCPRN